jgi:tripartite-type tricarboxylate transporter receptor subunit TctC
MTNTRILSITAAAGLGLLAVATPASAQSYPTHPIKIIVPTPAGGPVDVMARLVASSLSGPIGQNVIVDNRPGAGNTIGSKEAAMAAPDGYTLHHSSISGLVLAPMLHKSAGYDGVTSFDPIVAVAQSSNILVVNPSVPAKTVKELVDYAKANPGKVNFSSGGIGVLPHLIGELFKAQAHINVVHVPYRGGAPSINDLVAGQVQFTFEGTSVLLPLIRSGKLRALAVTTAQRIPELPDVPTMIESGFPTFVSTSWTGLLAPHGTPRDIIMKINGQVNAALKTPKFQDALKVRSSPAMGGTPEDFGKIVKDETAKWRPVVESLGLMAK